MQIILNILSLSILMMMATGCAALRNIAFHYSEVKLPDSQIIKNVKYWSSPDGDGSKNRLDLFLPSGKDWPVFIFVHGGEWISGDKSLKIMGSDIYGNIGRFFASNGIGVAVISYRLLPETNWKSQVMDVARAVNWVYQHIQTYHGNPKEIFLGGHSSGAQLAVRVALDSTLLTSLNSSPNIICGVIPISGAGYDLMDQETYDAAKKEDIFTKLFYTGDISKKMRRQFSPQRFVNAKAPPFLILYAAKEEKELKDGSISFHERLIQAGVQSELFEIPQKSHRTIVLSLSQPQQITTSVMLVFIKTLSCNGTHL